MVEVENLTKRFDDLVAVDNISFFVDRGEIFAFLGPNGAGKTTTIKMLTTLLRPSAGKILIKGENVKLFNSLIILCFLKYFQLAILAWMQF